MLVHRKITFLLSILIGIVFLLFSPLVNASQEKVYSLTINGAISPASADYFIRGLNVAVTNDAEILLLNLDTPGGLDKSMRIMIQAILNSPIPIVVYVSPKGARAASAGTYILYASHIAVMAPATNLGSATPVTIGMPKIPSPDYKKKMDENSEQPDTSDVMQRKMINDAQAYIRSLAQLRNRNEQWATEAVLKSANISAEEALEKKVIELIAYDQNTLLKSLHLREVNVGQKKITLQLVDPQVIEIKPDWRTELLIIITDPSMAYLLLIAGLYGLIFEFLHPGSMLPGTVGAICLLTAMYALSMLPINIAGLGLLILGIALMVAEAFMPSIGVLGIGGLVSFTIGSFMLMDSSLPGYQIAPALIIATSLSSAFLIIIILSMILKVRKKPPVSGKDELLNHHAIALEDFTKSGRVMIRGEIWQADIFREDMCQADNDDVITKDQKVLVKSIDGLRLKITAGDQS